jgi:hypothetical protein
MHFSMGPSGMPLTVPLFLQGACVNSVETQALQSVSLYSRFVLV